VTRCVVNVRETYCHMKLMVHVASLQNVCVRELFALDEHVIIVTSFQVYVIGLGIDPGFPDICKLVSAYT